MCINISCFYKQPKKTVKFNNNDKIHYYKAPQKPLPVKLLHMTDCTVVIENKSFNYDSDENFYLFL